VGPDVPVRLEGVVAMSRKFLVSQGKTTNNCLWGVFVSAPNLTETAANSGILVTSYGTDASVPVGGTKAYCPVPGQAPAGDAFPDDVKPGDVLDLAGRSDAFLPSACGQAAGESKIAQIEVANVTQATKTGAAAVPAAHVLSTSDVQALVSQDDTAFYNAWAGVKVRVAGLVSQPQGGAFTDAYGAFYLGSWNLRVGSKVFYVGALKASDPCHAGFQAAAPDTTFSRLDGFVYLDFCTWSLVPNDKCADLDPPSTDCTSATACVP
jgi:hypothetical protein